MSVGLIEPNVTAVLLTDGTWYAVEPDSFYTDSFEYLEDLSQLLSNADCDASLIVNQNADDIIGFSFTIKGAPESERIIGSVRSIVAVKVVRQ